MNFFGHACVASWYEISPGFVLGAMLPDFAGMLRLRVADGLDAEVARGVSLHYATDATFHSLPSFLELTRRSRRELSEAGLALGPARAVAHVGIELLIDEALAIDPRCREAYLVALSYAGSVDATSAFRLHGSESEVQTRWKRLIDTLRAKGASECAPKPTQVAERLARALSGRPRLAIDAASQHLVSNWVVSARPNVVGCADTIVTELRQRLDAAVFSRAVIDRPVRLG